MPIGNALILKTGILYNIIICALISLSCLYSSFLISQKTNKSEEDSAFIIFLNIFGIFWLICLVMNIFGLLGYQAAYRILSYLLNFVLFLQALPLIYYFAGNKYVTGLFTAVGSAFFILTFNEIPSLATISYWGVRAGVTNPAKIVFILGMMLPLAAFVISSIIKIRPGQFFLESIALIFVLLESLNILAESITWQLLLIRMFYILIGFIAYFYLSGEEATTRFASRIFPWVDKQIVRLRQRRIPFFTKLLLLFVLLSVLPIAAAGTLLFLTFKEIIDLYIYKPLLWNLKTSKEEFLIALGNVQVQSLLLIVITILLVVIASSIASRAIAQSLKRISFGMKRLEEGDLGYKVSPESNDEIGDLANYFNRMASEIKRSREIMENWNKELEKKVDERTKDLQTLYNLSKAMGSTLDLDELLSRAIVHIPRVAGTKCLAVFLRDEKGVFIPKVSRDCPELPPFSAGEGVFGEAVTSQQLVKVADIKAASEIEKVFLLPMNAKTLMLIPMESKGKKIGLIFIGIQREYTPGDIELNLLSTIADQMAIAVENAGVYEKEKEAVKRLIDIDRMKTELLSMVSHELRTPLTSIKGFLVHFLSGTTGPINDDQKRFLEIMSREGDHLLELIDGLLEFSRIERGIFSIKKEHVQIERLINGISEATRPQFESKKIKLALDLNTGDAAFMGDDLKVGQVLKNLIANAIKFSREGTEVGISSRILEPNSIEVRVKDSGIGMDREHLGKIFNKFYQVDGSLTRKIGGLGLGLAISKEIVEAHGGRIWAESEGPGKGSTFIFTLPMLKSKT